MAAAHSRRASTRSPRASHAMYSSHAALFGAGKQSAAHPQPGSSLHRNKSSQHHARRQSSHGLHGGDGRKHPGSMGTKAVVDPSSVVTPPASWLVDEVVSGGEDEPPFVASESAASETEEPSTSVSSAAGASPRFTHGVHPAAPKRIAWKSATAPRRCWCPDNALRR